MKGSELLRRLDKALEMNPRLRSQQPGGEIGELVRSHGYAVTYDGGSVCDFEENDVQVSYTASCCGHVWLIHDSVCLGPGWEWTRRKDIDVEKDYSVPPFKSVAKRYHDGEIQYARLVVLDASGGSLTRVREFQPNDIKTAEEVAKAKAREHVERVRKSDPDLLRYARQRIENNEQSGFIQLDATTGSSDMTVGMFMALVRTKYPEF